MNSEPHIVRSCECVGYTLFYHPLTSCHLPKASVFFLLNYLVGYKDAAKPER